jgi:hypothetical protein
LPQEKQAEVFDFVEFLAAQSGKGGTTPAEWSDAEFANLAMAQALRGLEGDPVAYTLADLRERWQ